MKQKKSETMECGHDIKEQFSIIVRGYKEKHCAKCAKQLLKESEETK